MLLCNGAGQHVAVLSRVPQQLDPSLAHRELLSSAAPSLPESHEDLQRIEEALDGSCWCRWAAVMSPVGGEMVQHPHESGAMTAGMVTFSSLASSLVDVGSQHPSDEQQAPFEAVMTGWRD